MQCFRMKHGLRDWKDWQDKLVLIEIETVTELRLKVSALAALIPTKTKTGSEVPAEYV